MCTKISLFKRRNVNQLHLLAILPLEEGVPAGEGVLKSSRGVHLQRNKGLVVT